MRSDHVSVGLSAGGLLIVRIYGVVGPGAFATYFGLRTRDQKLDNAAFALEPTLFYIAPALDMVGLHIVDKHTERTE